MKNQRKLITASMIASAVVLAAMGVSKTFDPNNTSYGRLLAKQYLHIAKIESRLGTFAHIKYFENKAHDAKSAHNPRPMTLRGFRNAKRRSSELLDMRWDLERAMVGYEKRYDPEAVAGMHAAFECRLVNIDVNPSLDQKCAMAFQTFKDRAEATVKAKKQQNIQYVEAPEPLPLPIATPAPVQQVQAAPKPMLKPMPLPQPQKIQQDQRQKLVPLSPMVGKNPQTEESVEDMEVIEIKTENKDSMIEVAPVQSMQPIPEASEIQKEEKKFDPLDYVHPRLRAKKRAEQQENMPVIEDVTPEAKPETMTPVPDVPKELPKPMPVKPQSETLPDYSNGDVDKAPVSEPIDNNMPTEDTEGEGFGIRPLSEMKVPQQAPKSKLNVSMMELRKKRYDTEPQKELTPRPEYMLENLAYDPIVTTSSAPNGAGPSADVLVIPFTEGGTKFSEHAEEVISQIKNKLANSNYSKVRFIGHADKGGSISFNDILSFRRAEKVHNYLEETLNNAGIKKVTVDGYGDRSPLKAYPATDDRNRRVVVELLK